MLGGISISNPRQTFAVGVAATASMRNLQNGSLGSGVYKLSFFNFTCRGSSVSDFSCSLLNFGLCSSV